jgi:hypothetical protein
MTQPSHLDVHHGSHLADRAFAGGPLPWSSILNLLAGLYLALCGWIFASELGRPGVVNAVIVGLLIAAIAAVRLASGPDRSWISWFNALLGAWTIASPWIFHFATGSSAAWNVVVTGLTIVVLACLAETAPEATAAGSARDYHRTAGWDYPYEAPAARPGESPTRYETTYHDGTEGMGDLATRPIPDDPRADEDIERDVRQGLALDASVRESDIRVRVVRGEVRLEGEVPDARVRRRAEEICDVVSGVCEVDNALHVRGEPEPIGPARTPRSI